VTPTRLSIRHLDHPTGDLLDFEIVERKGLGHPDTVCDEIAEALSLKLSRRYLAECGEILHHNVDKALLAGGASCPMFGGGEITRPMQLFLAGRAVTSVRGKDLEIDDLARRVAAEWITRHLPLIDPDRHLRVRSLVRPGSADLGSLFTRRSGQARLSNDTSCGVGYAPLSRLERIVFAVENELGAAAELGQHPEFGRDIKVMGIRRDEHVHLTVACGLVGRFVSDLGSYLDAKERIADISRQTAQKNGAGKVTAEVNVGDDPGGGNVYLTVTGTSAEAGDDGEAGRGNRINGLITPFRPMTMESVAGKNAVTHVGKLYNIAASLIAQRLVEELPGISEAHCLIVGQIGRPVDQPHAIEVSVRTATGVIECNNEIGAVIDAELARLNFVAEELVAGTLQIGRWPLRTAAVPPQD
jgi:S-adenosylmethionine synthetase